MASLHRDQGTSLYRAKLPDELSASMICLPETVKKLKVKGDHVAMLPVASVLYVTGSKDDDGTFDPCSLLVIHLICGILGDPFQQFLRLLLSSLVCYFAIMLELVCNFVCPSVHPSLCPSICLCPLVFE